MTVKEIVKEWLTLHGYDGLYDPNSGTFGCSCRVADVMDDYCEAQDCCPGHLVICACEKGFHILPGVSRGAKVPGPTPSEPSAPSDGAHNIVEGRKAGAP